ncbi:hypothetical protein CRYUN_Cryun04dG0055200 [Craigia yunnanensis]
MESLSCLVLKPPAPTRLFAPRLSQMAASGSATFLSSLVFPSSLDYQLPKKLQKGSGSNWIWYREMEAVILVDVLRRAGAESVEPQLEIQVFDLVALPGGMPGPARLRDCEILKKITSKQAEEKRLYGVCHARQLATMHSLTISQPSRAVKSNIQVSGELKTSQGPGTSFLFALALVEQLFRESVAKEIGELLFMHSAVDKPRKEEFNKVDWAVAHTPHVSYYLLQLDTFYVDSLALLVTISCSSSNCNGSEEIEVVTIIDILRRAKVDVLVASVEKSVKEGVAGAERLQKSRILKKLLKEQDEAGNFLKAVCYSPRVMHKHGQKATAHPSTIRELTNAVDGPKVVIDGKLITSRGLATVSDFALAIVSKFFGHARARSVAEGLVF